MANDSNGASKGMKNSLGMGIKNSGGKVNDILDTGTDSIGIPYGQAPGIGSGFKENSMNQLPNTAKVWKPAKSDLMTGMSDNRGKGGNK